MKNTENSNLDNDNQLGDHLRTHASRFEASQNLRDRIRTQSPSKATTRAFSNQSRLFGKYVFSWPSASAGLIGGVIFTLVLVFSVGPQIEALVLQPSLENTLVSRHVYSMDQGRLFEVASSDRHAVKPWFQGKLDFSPPVPDLASAGFNLRGGRVDHIDGRAVAALAYMHKLHIVNVFVWPSDKTQSPQPSARRGFNLLHWDDGTMQIWLVSDVEATELNRFGQAWRAQISSPSLTRH